MPKVKTKNIDIQNAIYPLYSGIMNIFSIIEISKDNTNITKVDYQFPEETNTEKNLKIIRNLRKKARKKEELTLILTWIKNDIISYLRKIKDKFFETAWIHWYVSINCPDDLCREIIETLIGIKKKFDNDPKSFDYKNSIERSRSFEMNLNLLFDESKLKVSYLKRFGYLTLIARKK